jgi:hypothetical protein
MTVTAGAVQKPNNTGSSQKKFFDFMARSSAQLGRTLGQPDAGNVVQSTTNETGVAIDLTTEFGASAFQTDTIYRIVFRSIATVAAKRWVQVWEQYLLGGTTPVLMGSPTILSAYGIVSGVTSAYGLVRYHGTTSGATVTNAADRSAGLSLGNFSGGVATLTIPQSRATARCLGAHFSEDAGAIADARVLQVRSASATTMTVNAFNNTGAEALADPTGVNNVDLALEVMPPPGIVLAMSTNNVQAQISHDTAENCRHAVDVWIEEDPTQAPFQA